VTDVPVAVSDAETGAALAAALASHVVHDGGPYTPYYALVVPGTSPNRGRRDLYALHCGDDVVVQSRHPDRVFRALLAHLAAAGDLQAAGLVAVPGLVVAAGGRALLVPRPERPVAFTRALARHGVATADMPAALVDAVRADVIVGAPGLDIDFDPLDRHTASLPSFGDEPAPLAWGRYPLAGIVAPGANPGRALLELAPLADRHPEAAVDALVRLIDRLPLVDAGAPGRGDPAAIAAALDAGTTRP
jgi:hypothetical protein